MSKNSLATIGIGIASGAGILLVSSLLNFRQPIQERSHVLAIQPVLTPTPKIQNVHSGDGTKNLSLREGRDTQTGTKTYTLVASDVEGGNTHTILTTSVPSDETVSLPYNSWSPDNKYVFVQTTAPAQFLVLKASGEAFADEKQYLEVGPVFVDKKTGNTLSEVTGWASPTLLILTSTTASGERGPSYWFEVPSKVILQLAH